MSDVDLAKIKYSFRHGCFHSACQDAANALKKESCNREILMYYKAVSRAMNGYVDDLEFLRKMNRGKLEYPIICALQYFYTKLDANDHILQKLKIGSTAAFLCINAEGAILAAEFSIWISHNCFETSCCLDKISALRPNADTEIQRIRLWLQVVSDQEFVDIDKPLKLECAGKSKDIDCLMALARYHEVKGNTTEAFNALRKVKSLESTFFPVFIEISKLHLSMTNFALAEESSRIAAAMATKHIEAQHTLVMTKLLNRSYKKEHHIDLQLLLQLFVNQKVPLHSKLWPRSLQLFSRICGYDKAVLQVVVDTMINICGKSFPVDISLSLEYARTLRCLGRYGEALSQYQVASQIDDSHMAEGLVLCQVLNGDVEQAMQQIEFIELMQEDNVSATVELMLAKVLVHRETDSRCFEEIFKTVELALRPFQTHRGTLSAYGTCDLSLILLLIQHVIHHLDFARGDENESRICSIIMRLISLYPSNNEASCLLSKVQLKLKDYEGFKATFDSSLKHSHEPALAKITKAQYYLLTGQIKAGLEILEEALSENFSIQNHPYFCFVKGSLLLEMGEMEVADKHLSNVLHFLSTASTNQMITLITKQDIIKCFIDKSKVLKKQNRTDSINDLLPLMDQIFISPMVFACLKAKSDLLLEIGDMDKALNLFNIIPKASGDYESGQFAKADIYLKHNYRSEYIECYRNVSLVNESLETLSMLGDACVKMANPLALKAYRRALDFDPLNEDLVLKISSIHINAGDTDNAVHILSRYLKRAPQSNKVKIKLMNLYSILEYDKEALLMLQSCTYNQEEVKTLDRDAYVQILIATADIYCRKRQYEKARDCLIQGIDILSKSQPKQKGKILATVLSKLADCHAHLGYIQLAVGSIRSALQIHPKGQSYYLQLAKLFYKDNQYNKCILICEEHFIHNEENYIHNEETMLLMIDSFMKKSELETALKKCAAAYGKHKNYSRLLCKYIILLQKMGEISQVNKIYDDLETLEFEGNVNDGQQMCTGLCRQFLGDTVGALESFNAIRNSEKWSHESLKNMVRIYLRMGDFDYWSSLHKGIHARDVDGTSEAADSLLSILEKTLPEDREVSVFRGYWEMIVLGGSNILDRFNNILRDDENYIPALLALALQGVSTPKIMRNSLKKIAMMPFDISYAIEFEHSYLLLAEDYIERGNFDLANDLAKRCLYYNRSSIKAWEIFGKTTELQNGSCNDVVQSYEKCWSLGNKSSHLSGYRLTALYIKMNKLTEALNTLPRVYSLSPENVSFKSLVSTLALSLRP